MQVIKGLFGTELVVDGRVVKIGDKVTKPLSKRFVDDLKAEIVNPALLDQEYQYHIEGNTLFVSLSTKEHRQQYPFSRFWQYTKTTEIEFVLLDKKARLQLAEAIDATPLDEPAGEFDWSFWDSLGNA